MSELETTCPTSDIPGQPNNIRVADQLARKLFFRQFEKLDAGSLVFEDFLGRREFGDARDAGSSSILVNVWDTRFYTDVILGGTVGAAEAYIRGYWSCDDLTGLIRFLVVNRPVLDNMNTGAAKIAAPLRRILHHINRNTKAGSRRNISAHYDLGNEFFRLWLDETMMYSAAVFERPDMTLREASVAKLDRICRKLALTPADHVLEIGTGWGGFAVHAAQHYGCRVTTTTISKEQFEYAKERVARAGLSDRVTLLLEDYRDLEGQYDKIVSIEMIEAIGHEFLDVYFGRCTELLRPDGMMLLQAITIADQRYDAALKSVDFIQRYIFPGGFLPSVNAMLRSVTRSTDMRIYHLEDIGAHYAMTLNQWRDRFSSSLQRVREQGFSEEFIRMWQYYFCYCEGAFVERAIGNVQILLTKPACRREPIVPALAGF